MALTAEFVEREYNNRALVPAHGEYFARWERDTAYVRKTMPCTLDLAYGPHPRHRIDLYPAADARATLVFIHGGYWRSLDKATFGWIAAAYVPAGLNVALLNYRLCPEVRIADIVGDVREAMRWLAANGAAHGVAMERVVVSGHSAGGHLTAALLATPRESLGFDARTVVGAVPVSGVFDFTPLPLFSGNADFHLDAAQVRQLDLLHRQPTIEAPLVIAAGAAESSEFQRQSRDLARAWAPQVRSLLLLPGLDHFSVVDAFAERGQPLYEATLALAR